MRTELGHYPAQGSACRRQVSNRRLSEGTHMTKSAAAPPTTGRKKRPPKRLVFDPPATLEEEIAAVSAKTSAPVERLRDLVRDEARAALSGLRGQVMVIYLRSIDAEGALKNARPVAEYRRSFNHGTGETELAVLPAEEPAS